MLGQGARVMTADRNLPSAQIAEGSAMEADVTSEADVQCWRTRRSERCFGKRY
jgi:hypothetical protein